MVCTKHKCINNHNNRSKKIKIVVETENTEGWGMGLMVETCPRKETRVDQFLQDGD